MILQHLIIFFGNWKGNSLFRTNYEDRGNNNLLKEKYLLGLNPELLESL